MVRPIGEKGDHDPRDDLPALREPSMLVLVDDLNLRCLIRPTGNLGLETLNALDRIQPEIVGIGANEADGVGSAWQCLEAIFLQGFKMVLADLERARDGGQIVAATQ